LISISDYNVPSVQVQPPNKVHRFLKKVKDGVTKISVSQDTELY